MNKIRWLVLLVVLPALIVVLASCSDDEDDADPTATVVSEPLPTASDDGDDGEVEPVQLEVTAQNFSFSPSAIQAPEAVPFIIVFENTDVISHNLAIFMSEDDAKTGGDPIAATEIEPGPNRQELSVGPLAAGDYFVWCQVHTASMTASLSVE